MEAGQAGLLGGQAVESAVLEAEGGLGTECLRGRLGESRLLVLLHLAGSCLPEAGEVAEVLTGPEICLRSLGQSQPQAWEAPGSLFPPIQAVHPGLPGLSPFPSIFERSPHLLLLGPLRGTLATWCGSRAGSVKPAHPLHSPGQIVPIQCQDC